MLLILCAQHAIKRRLRGQVHTFIGQTRHNLRGRQTGKTTFVRRRNNLRTLGIA
jgi:hypothetical protein